MSRADDCPPTWRVQISAKPTPAEPDPDLLAVWRACGLSSRYDGTGDREDWTEQAVRLQVAREVLEDAVLTTDLHTGRDLHTLKRRRLPVSGPVWGVIASTQRWFADEADYYMSSATFARHAGREVTLCGFEPTMGSDIREAASMMQALGHDDVIVKGRRPKSGLWRIKLGDDPADALRHAMDWALIREEGQPHAFLLQQVVPMTFEYRLFVVNHEVVTGAGCVEHLTPPDMMFGPFDPAVQRWRGRGAAFDRPDVVEQLVAFGREVVAEWAAEQPSVGDYALDVAMGACERPLVIERNSLPNAGLYASDPTAVLRARVRALEGWAHV